MSKEINSNDSNSFPSNNGSNKSPNSNSSFSFGKYLKNPADIGIKKNEIWNQSNSEAHQNWNDYQSGPVHNSGSGFVPVTTHKIGTIGQQEFTTNPVSTSNTLFGSFDKTGYDSKAGFAPATAHKIEYDKKIGTIDKKGYLSKVVPKKQLTIHDETIDKYGNSALDPGSVDQSAFLHNNSQKNSNSNGKIGNFSFEKYIDFIQINDIIQELKNTTVSINGMTNELKNTNASNNEISKEMKNVIVSNNEMSKEMKNVTEEMKNVTKEMKNVTKEMKNVIASNNEMSKDMKNVITSNNEMSKEMKNVITSNNEMSKDMKNVITSNNEMSKDMKNVIVSNNEINKEMKNIAKIMADFLTNLNDLLLNKKQ